MENTKMTCAQALHMILKEELISGDEYLSIQEMPEKEQIAVMKEIIDQAIGIEEKLLKFLEDGE